MQNNLQLTWQQERFCVSHDYRFIYVPIPKVACTSLKVLVAMCNNETSCLTKFRPLLHSYVNKTMTLSTYEYEKTIQLLDNKDYFKFTFCRNPYHRLVSAYYSKFFKLIGYKKIKDEAKQAAKEVVQIIRGKELSESELTESITFTEFIHYLSVTDDLALNIHWQPQHLIIDGITLRANSHFLENKV